MRGDMNDSPILDGNQAAHCFITQIYRLLEMEKNI